MTEVSEIPVAPKVGQYLFSSCAGSDYGRIISVGNDANKRQTIDIEIFGPNDLISCEGDNDPDSPQWPVLTTLEVPEGVNLILRNVQWEIKGATDFGTMIECNTPGNGCYRCTKLFTLQDHPTK